MERTGKAEGLGEHRVASVKANELWRLCPIEVRMAAEEQACLTVLMGSAQSYVEFGCGRSTVFASTVITKLIIALDSSQEWLIWGS
jgi:hypothetical protein